MVQTICLALMGPRGRLLCHYGTTRRGCGQLRGFGLLGRCIVPMSYREASVFGPMRSLMIFGLTPAFRAPVTYEWRSAMEGNAWEHGRRGEAVEPLSDRRRMPRASVRATGLPVAPIRLRRRQRTDGPRTPTDLREDPRTRNDVQDADESLASWTRHRIGVRQRHRRRITGAPARFACPFLEPRTAINDQDRAPHLRGRFRTRRVHRATERAPVCIGIEQRSPRPVDMGEVSSGPCESRSSEQSCRARLRSRWHLPRIRQPPRRCASARTVGTTCLICTPVTRQRRSGRSITR